MSKPLINFEKFKELTSQLEITIGEIVSVESIKKSRNQKLTVSFGSNEIDHKVVVTNLQEVFLPGNKIPFITNIEPGLINKIESHAIILVGLSIANEIELGNYTVGTKLLQ